MVTPSPSTGDPNRLWPIAAVHLRQLRSHRNDLGDLSEETFDKAPVSSCSFGGIPVRWIPPGSFMMGSPDSEKERDSDETQHEVVLSQGFFMAETECILSDNPRVNTHPPPSERGAMDTPPLPLTHSGAEALGNAGRSHQGGVRNLDQSPGRWNADSPVETADIGNNPATS